MKVRVCWRCAVCGVAGWVDLYPEDSLRSAYRLMEAGHLALQEKCASLFTASGMLVEFRLYSPSDAEKL